MPLNSPYYHQCTLSHIVNFGNLFNEISITRKASDNSVVKTLLVPIHHLPKEKWLYRVNKALNNIDKDDNDDKPTPKYTLPRMAFEITNMRYDPERHTNTLTKNAAINPLDSNQASWQFSRVPYNWDFNLYIGTRYMDDGLQILEQILPYFTPQISTYIIDNADISPTKGTHVPVVLNGVDSSFSYEDSTNWDSVRMLMWTLSFTSKGYLYSDTKTQNLIKNTVTNIKNDLTCATFLSTEMDVSPEDASVDDDYVVITSTTTNE